MEKASMPQPQLISPESILINAAKLCTQVLHNDEYFTLEGLANSLNVEASSIGKYFGSMSGLQLQILDYIKALCQERVFDIITNSRHCGIRLAVHFLKLVDDLFLKYPECSYWFKAYFYSDMTFTKAYSAMVDFYTFWEKETSAILIKIIPKKEAKRISKIYTDLMKAALLNSPFDSQVDELFSAKFFLFNAAVRVLKNGERVIAQ